MWDSVVSTVSPQAGQSGDQIPVGGGFSTTIQNGPEAHPASYTMGTGSLLGGKEAKAWH
jgi:hypothetical protein